MVPTQNQLAQMGSLCAVDYGMQPQNLQGIFQIILPDLKMVKSRYARSLELNREMNNEEEEMDKQAGINETERHKKRVEEEVYITVNFSKV